jgi:hypothetical protein
MKNDYELPTSLEVALEMWGTAKAGIEILLFSICSFCVSSVKAQNQDLCEYHSPIANFVTAVKICPGRAYLSHIELSFCSWYHYPPPSKLNLNFPVPYHLTALTKILFGCYIGWMERRGLTLQQF